MLLCASRLRHEHGTLQVPCRAAMQGAFPLAGTYFQINEVFLDDSTLQTPLEVRTHMHLSIILLLASQAG